MSSTKLTVLKSQPLIFWPAVVSVLALLFNLIGTALVPSAGVNWFYLFFYLLVTVGVVGAVATETVHEYKLLLVVLIAISLSFLPTDIQSGISAAQASSALNNAFGGFEDFGLGTSLSKTANKYAAGGGLRATGLILYFFAFLAQLVALTVSKLPWQEAAPEKAELEKRDTVVVLTP